MIIRPEKGLFFVATLLMCSVSIYAAELADPRSDPLERIFVGVPTQLSLPPGFLAPVGAGETGNVATMVRPEPQVPTTEIRPATAVVGSDAREPVDEPKPETAVLSAPLSAEERKSAVAGAAASAVGAAVVAE
jgi:hypothetical protein